MNFIEKNDTPEKREGRVQALINTGLSRPDAEHVDTKAVFIMDELMSTLERWLLSFGKERPDLGLSLYHTVIVMLERTAADGHADFHREIGNNDLDLAELLAAVLVAATREDDEGSIH